MTCAACRYYTDCSLSGELEPEEKGCARFAPADEESPGTRPFREAIRRMNEIGRWFRSEQEAFGTIDFSSSSFPPALRMQETVWRHLARMYRWRYDFKPGRSVTFFNPDLGAVSSSGPFQGLNATSDVSIFGP